MVLHINMPFASFISKSLLSNRLVQTLSPFFPNLVSSCIPPPPQNSHFSATATCLCHQHAFCKEVPQNCFFFKANLQFLNPWELQCEIIILNF